MMTSNETTMQGIATSPRAIVLVDGTQVNVNNIDIVTAQFGYADSFSIDIPLIGQPSPINRAYFANNQSVLVSIYIGFPSNINSFSTSDLDLMITGNADRYEDNLCSNLIKISGRDLTSKFIDTKISQKFANQLSSDIVSQFATQQGLKTQVTKTSTPVGAFYYNQQTLLTNQSSQWDVITYLAQQEGYNAFVSGDTFVFEPKTTQNASTYILNYVPITDTSPIPYGNFISMEVMTNTTMAGDVQVTVRVPYDTKTGQSYSVKVKASQKAGSGNSLGTKKYVYKKPGLTPEQAQQLAQQLLEQHTSQGVGLSFTLAGDNVLKKDTILQLKGTGTIYDQYYFPDEIRRTFHFEDESGYKMYVYARNTAQNLETDNNV